MSARDNGGQRPIDDDDAALRNASRNYEKSLRRRKEISEAARGLSRYAFHQVPNENRLFIDVPAQDGKLVEAWLTRLAIVNQDTPAKMRETKGKYRLIVLYDIQPLPDPLRSLYDDDSQALPEFTARLHRYEFSTDAISALIHSHIVSDTLDAMARCKEIIRPQQRGRVI